MFLKKSKLITICLLIVFITQSEAKNIGPLIWNLGHIENLRVDPNLSTVRKQIISNASRYAKMKPVSVMDKKKAFNPDKHYYQSLAIYFWPDSLNKNGRYKQRDGIYNPEYKDYDYVNLCSLLYRLEFLSVAYYISGDDEYYDAFVKQLDTWFIDKDTYMLPNFEYSQVTPGSNNNQGRSEGLIDGYCFNGVLDAIRVVSFRKRLPSYTRRGLKKWFLSFEDWLTTSSKGLRAYKFVGNHAVNYDLLRYNIAMFVGNEKICRQIFEEFANLRLLDEIDSIGRQPRELNRTRSYFYQIYNLTHIIDICFVMNRNGQYLYKENAELINKVGYYLLSYKGKQEKYPYKELGPWNELFKLLIIQLNRINRLAGRKLFNVDEQRITSGSNLESYLNS